MMAMPAVKPTVTGYGTNFTNVPRRNQPASASITVADSGPIIEVLISPEEPSTASEITCSWTAYDPDGEPVTEESALWYVEGVEAGDGALPLSADLSKDDRIDCQVTATSSDRIGLLRALKKPNSSLPLGLKAMPKVPINISPGVAVFTTGHGDPPELAGTGRANPLSLLFSSVLMLRHLDENSAADRLMEASKAVLSKGTVPSAAGGNASCRTFLEAVQAAL